MSLRPLTWRSASACLSTDAIGAFMRRTREDKTALEQTLRVRNQASPSRLRNTRYLAALSMLGGVALIGCGGGTTGSNVKVGQIAFTDIDGNAATAVSSLKVGSGSYLDAVVTNDPQALGINWSVTCASALPVGAPLPPGQTVDESCGTFTAAHTATAPVPSYASSGAGIVTFYQAPAAVPANGTVTITAAATVDPSISSTLTLTIIGVPLSIGFAPAPPSSLAVDATAQIGALVSNDSSAGGVKWSVTCASMACGTFSATQTPSVTKTTYTAPDAVPSGGTVTITATSVTDPTKSVSADVTISQTAPAETASGPTAYSRSAEAVLARLSGESK